MRDKAFTFIMQGGIEYHIKWGHGGMGQEQYQEIGTGKSLTDSIQGSEETVVYLEIEENIPSDLLTLNLSGLKQLQLKSIGLCQPLQQLLSKVTPESLSFIGGDFSNGIPKLPTSLNKLEMIRCRLRVKEKVTKLDSLEWLSVENSEFGTAESLERLLKAATSLQKLNVTGCENAKLPKSLKHLKELVHLDLYSTHLESENQCTLAVFNDLQNLKRLTLSECKLPLVPESVMNLRNLTKLNLTRNKLLGQTIPNNLYGLEALKELSLGTCYLSELPSSLSSLTTLESLDLSNNHLSATDALKPVESLTRLTCLSLSGCNLDTLPEMKNFTELYKLEIAHNNFCTAVRQGASPDLSILDRIPTRVSELDTSGNNFSGGLPHIVGNLKHMTDLNISACSLSIFPESISGLTDLQALDLSRNNLTDLPESIKQLRRLRSLNIERSRNLHSIINISTLHSLEKLNVLYCNSLVSPPLEVCRQGLQSIQQFCLNATGH